MAQLFNKYDSYVATGLVILWAILAGLETSKGGCVFACTPLHTLHWADVCSGFERVRHAQDDIERGTARMSCVGASASARSSAGWHHCIQAGR